MIATIMIGSTSLAQVIPGVQWQKCFGSSNRESLISEDTTGSRSKSFIQTLDGGYIIGGTTSSDIDDGDIVGTKGGGDIWVAKLDTARQISWQKCLGGDLFETFGSVTTCPDGGYIVCGSTYSYIVDGSPKKGETDAYIIKLNSSGAEEWHKLYGGSQGDEAYNIQPTSDGGYIFVGRTGSADGDVVGWHDSGLGVYDDIWVVKLSSTGDIQWQKCLGGSRDDQPAVVRPMPGGGYFVVGSTNSTDGDVTNPLGFQDMWAIRLSESGTIIWQKTYGGSGDDYAASAELTFDNGFLIAGITRSGTCGSTTVGPSDGHIVKISSTGALEWENCYGTAIWDDFFSDLKILPGGEFITVGHSRSNNFPVNNRDGWIAKFTSDGNLIWEKFIGGTGLDKIVSVSNLNNGDLLLYGVTASNNGDVSGNHGLGDLWLVKLGSSNTIKGTVFFDANANGTKDLTEEFIDMGSVNTSSSADSRSTVPVNGQFSFDAIIGDYVTTFTLPTPAFISVPSSHNSSFTNFFNKDSFSFAIQPAPTIVRDLYVSLIPLTPARPGFAAKYRISYINRGNQIISNGKLRFIKTSQSVFASSIPDVDNLVADTLEWNVVNFEPLDTASIEVSLQIKTPPTVNAGNTIRSIAAIGPIDTDISPADDTSLLNQMVVGSYDPNDKKENFGGKILPSQVTAGDFLHYVIRFQNTGTDTAFSVVIRDTLNSKVDENSLEMIASSHPYRFTRQANRLTWEFTNILLPDSNVNEPSSHGFLAFRIKPRNTLVIGDTIKNAASIYFDFNLPVSTNVELTVVQSSVLPMKLADFRAFQLDNEVEVNWRTATESKLSSFEIERSKNGIEFERIGSVTPLNAANGASYSFSDYNPVKGKNYYRLKSVDLDGSATYSKTVLVDIGKSVELITSTSPNPTKGFLKVKVSGSVSGEVRMTVIDQEGKQLVFKTLGKQHTTQLSFELDLRSLSKGAYILILDINGHKFHHKLIIQ